MTRKLKTVFFVVSAMEFLDALILNHYLT